MASDSRNDTRREGLIMNDFGDVRILWDGDTANRLENSINEFRVREVLPGDDEQIAGLKEVIRCHSETIAKLLPKQGEIKITRGELERLMYDENCAQWLVEAVCDRLWPEGTNERTETEGK